MTNENKNTAKQKLEYIIDNSHPSMLAKSIVASTKFHIPI